MWGVRLGNQQTGPQFVQPLPGNIGEIEENTALHLACKVEPFHEDSLQIFWLHNGRPLNHGHRFRTFHDFGLVTLDILHVYAEDSGTFTCVAENPNGRAETSTDFYCHPKDSILDQTQLPTSVARIQELEAPKGPLQDDEPEIVYNPANFIKPLQGSIQANEGESVFLEAKAGPVEDNTLIHEWYFHNQPLMHANRFVTSQEFGVITMNILHLYPEDTGTYTLFVRNATGQAQSSVDIKVAGNGSMFVDTLHPKSINRINELEAPKPPPEQVPEAEKKQPAITKQLNSIPTCNEGDSAHFEAKYTPIDDNQVTVEWLFNGRPIKHSNRHRMINDFGNVSLEINYLFVEDSGEYTLIVKNRKGQAQTSTKLQINGSERILDNTMHPKSLPRIQQLEMPPALPEEMPEKPQEPPKFKRALQLVVTSQDGNRSSQAIQEGDDVKIDCTVSPVTDNQLRIEWYFNGQPLLHSNRIRITNDLGYVALQFAHICARDSGTYTCRAISPCGSAEASIGINVQPAADMLLETQHEKSWKEIFEMENRIIERPETPEARFEAPRFAQNLSNVENAVEGDTIRLECRLKPVDDPSLTVLWTFNGNPLFEANRFRYYQNMDLVALEITKAVAEDSGRYECHASSAYGQISTGCEVKVRATESLLLSTQNERTWSKIQQLEITDELPEPPEKPFSAPKFSQNLESVKLKEGETIRLSTRVSPHDDPGLSVAWLKDGQPLFISNRVHQVFEFGLVALEIVHSIQNDAGNYTVVAKNAAGQVQLSAKVEIEGNQSIVADVQHELSWRKIQELEAPKTALEEVPEKKHGPPQFWSQLHSIKDAVEGETVKLEAKVKPIDDPNLVITWFHDNQVLGASNRFVTRNEFGHVSLEILYVMEQDAGTYRCVATNEHGQASSEAKVECKLNPAIWSQTQHEKSLKRIQELEAPKPEKPEIEPVYLVAPKRMNCFMRKNH